MDSGAAVLLLNDLVVDDLELSEERVDAVGLDAETAKEGVGLWSGGGRNLVGS